MFQRRRHVPAADRVGDEHASATAIVPATDQRPTTKLDSRVAVTRGDRGVGAQTGPARRSLGDLTHLVEERPRRVEQIHVGEQLRAQRARLHPRHAGVRDAIQDGQGVLGMEPGPRDLRL